MQRLSLMTANKNEVRRNILARLASHAANKWSSVERGRESRAAAGITINTFKSELHIHAMTRISRSIHTRFSRVVCWTIIICT